MPESQNGPAITVRFPPHLRRFIDVPEQVISRQSNIRAILDEIEIEYPGVRNYLLHENGKVRQHVNFFLDDRIIQDRDTLTDDLSDVKELVIFQALSGG